MLTDDETKNLDQLISGSREPLSGMEKHFILVMKGFGRPCTPKEREWFEYWKNTHTQETTDTNINRLYIEAIRKIREREERILALEQHIIELEQESIRLGNALNNRDNSVENLEKEVERLHNFLKSAHTKLQQYEPSKPVKNNEPTNWEVCHQCGGDGGAGGRCPRCGGNGFEPK